MNTFISPPFLFGIENNRAESGCLLALAIQTKPASTGYETRDFLLESLYSSVRVSVLEALFYSPKTFKTSS
ncbi:hypothetical protein [Nostoc sp.]|uniref:hypothetical protein n=1 Tax=Nostoc sp. TaxID=1180 RepID=UPI002FF95A7A